MKEFVKNDVEDEEHFIFDCSKLEHIRKHFFHRLASISPSFIHMSRIERLKFILGNNEYDLNVICLTYLHDTPGPLYNTLHYNTVLDITLISVGPQLHYFCYMSIHLTLIKTRIG